jgi:hypothetical protein
VKTRNSSPQPPTPCPRIRSPTTSPIVFHDLQHTFGTLAVQVWPVTDVQAYMGHADIKTTMRYVHHVPKHDAAERFSRFVDGQLLGSTVLTAGGGTASYPVAV